MTKKFSQHIFRVALGKVTNRSSRKARQNVQGQRGCDQIPFFASEADRPPSHFEVLNQHPEGEECGGQECVVLMCSGVGREALLWKLPLLKKDGMSPSLHISMGQEPDTSSSLTELVPKLLSWD